MRPAAQLFLALILFCSLCPTSQAAPLQLQATGVTTGDPCGFQVAGVNFGFEGRYFGFCTGTMFAEAGYPVYVEPEIYAPAFGQFSQGQNLTIGSISVPENPGRVALLKGAIYGPELAIPVPLYEIVSQVSENAFLVGSLSACLLPAGYVSGPCDPA